MSRDFRANSLNSQHSICFWLRHRLPLAAAPERSMRDLFQAGDYQPDLRSFNPLWATNHQKRRAKRLHRSKQKTTPTRRGKMRRLTPSTSLKRRGKDRNTAESYRGHVKRSSGALYRRGYPGDARFRDPGLSFRSRSGRVRCEANEPELTLPGQG